MWVLKLDGNGNKIWDRTLGGTEFDGISRVILSGDGGYLLLGSSSSSESGDKTENSRGLRDGWVIKMDGNGEVQWDRTIGGSGNDYLRQGLSISGGGYLLGGYSESNVSGEKSQNSKGSFDYWIIKIDVNGNILWDRTYGGVSQDIIADLFETEDGGFLLAGNSASSISGDKSENSRGGKDYWIIRVDQEGQYLWDKTYGGNSEDLLVSILPAGDGSFILSGDSSSTISGEKSERANTIDYWILKIDASGNLVWDKTIGGNSRDWTPFLCAADGGGYLLAGGSDSGIAIDKSEGSRGQIDYWVVKIDEQGNKVWDKTLGGNSDDSISSIISTGNGFVLGGSSNSSISGEKTENNHSYLSDLWLVKISDATPSISGFTLINAETNEDILTLTDGAEISLTDLPTTLLNIRANTTGNTSKVLLEISGALTNSRSEGVAPYALYGDTSGDYNAQEFIPGDYTLTATPFSGSSPGTPLTIQFSIVEPTTQAPFVTTWKTDNPGTSADNQITIPVSSEFVYNYQVDWGDGNIDAGVTGSITHTYSAPGTYTVKIQGVFPQPYFVNEGDKEKLLSIDQWGDIQWGSMLNAFHGCSNLELNASDIPDFSKVQNTQYMFRLCGSMQGHSSMSSWDMSNVTTMDFMFREASEFNQDISGWDVSQVYSMVGMFAEAHAFNSPLISWNVAKVENMDRMFSNALLFNQPIGNWDVGAVTNMGAMFFGAKSFNQDIGNWNVSNVQNLIFTFGEAIAFNQDLSAWDLSSAIDISFMFANADSFNSDISQWTTSNIRYMNSVFSRAASFDQNLSSWDVSSVESMIDIFNRSGLSQKNYDAVLNGWAQLGSLQSGVTMGAGSITYCTGADARQNLIDSFGWVITDGGEDCPGNLPFITTWKTDNPGSSAENQITIPTYPGETYNYTVDWGDGTSDTGVGGDMVHTYDSPGIYEVKITGEFPQIYFAGERDRLKLLEIRQWGNIRWKSMNYAFRGCANMDVTATDIPDLSGVSNLTAMFLECSSLIGNESMGDWDVSNVQDFASMFANTDLFNQPIGNWNMSKATSIDAMFAAAQSFNQDISLWDVSQIESMVLTFASAFSFNQDISGWDVSNVKAMTLMFDYNTAFNQDIGQWNTNKVISFYGMFRSATAFNQNLGRWDVSAAITMVDMFRGARSFDQDLGNWNVSMVTRMDDMFLDAGLSVENYDNLLRGWNELPSLQNGVTFHAGNSMYCSGASARQNLINAYGWAINDAGENCPAGGAFITTWKTDNPGYSEDNQITIPTYPGETYYYTVDWGDGTSDSGLTGNITHSYATPGTYQVAITGTFPQIFFNDDNGLDDIYPDREKILSIDQWGSIQWKSMNSAFIGCYNLDMLATDVPDLSQVTSLANMFNVCPSLIGNDSFREWDVSTIMYMGAMFAGTNLFNIDIGNWDVSNVREMSAMFLGALSFNQDIGSWNVGNVTGMSSMFLNAQAFNQDLSDWDVGNVTHMSSMFQLATSFNQPLGSWNVSQVTDMTNMFLGVTLSLQHYDNLLNGWANLPSLQNGVAFHGGNSEFCLAVEAHQKLTGKYGWAITDGGTECPGVTLAVTGFVLVDADTDQEIISLSEGQIVNIATLPGMNLNIRADATDDVSSVGLSLTGSIVAQRTENVAPYALFGDSGGDYSGELFSTGTYTMTATPFSGRNLEGNAGTELSVSFEFVDSTPDCITFGVTSAGIGKVTNCSQPDGFATVVVSGATGPVSYSWSHDAALNEPEAYNLSAGSYTLTYSDTFCSKEITFEIEAVLPEVSLQAFDDIAADASPIPLTGGLPEGGTYSGPGVTNGIFDPSVGPGIYEIIYRYENAGGCTNTATQSISVSSSSIAVTSFTLVDADSDLDLLTLEEGMAYDLSNLPTTFFNIRANATDNAGSVVINLTGGLTSQRNENVAPFALFGDTNGNYSGNQLPVGSYTVTAVPYGGSGGTGQIGESLSISFTLFQSGTGKQATESQTKGYQLAIHPNSASTSVNVSLTDSSVKIRSILVHDLSGRKVGEFNAQDFLQGTDYVLPVYQFQSGIYLITTIDSNGTINQDRLSVQN